VIRPMPILQQLAALRLSSGDLVSMLCQHSEWKLSMEYQRVPDEKHLDAEQKMKILEHVLVDSRALIRRPRNHRFPRSQH